MKKENLGVRVNWAMLCENASVDQNTNTVSLFNVLEELTLSQGPLSVDDVKAGGELMDFPEKTQVNSKHVLVVQVERETGANKDSKIQMQLEVADPSGEVLLKNEFPILFGVSDVSRTRAIISFDGMLVTKSGKYTYTISTKSVGAKIYTKQYSVILDVKIRK